MMRNTLIFAGSSCPVLTEQICCNLAMSPAAVELSQFANGETSVKILTSIREKDVYVVQSGSSKINDSIMELLILISACKGGSANQITAVLPYFPYSRQSKKKSHRGAITARMLANLLHIAGVKHVITIDLHASQMQGFFKCPVDNLHAEPLISRWIRHSVPNWQEAVCVSKNAGGTKRVTSLADALKLNFGMVTTDKKRRGHGNMTASMIINRLDGFLRESEIDHQMSMIETLHTTPIEELKQGTNDTKVAAIPESQDSCEEETQKGTMQNQKLEVKAGLQSKHSTPPRSGHRRQDSDSSQQRKLSTVHSPFRSQPLTAARSPTIHAMNNSVLSIPADEDAEFIDERARDIIQGRLIHGHIVPDDYPSPTHSTMSSSIAPERLEDDLVETSHASPRFSQHKRVLAGAEDVDQISDDEEESFKNPSLEQMITLVGDVRNRTVFIVDDMIDKAGSWIAAAECVVKRGGAKKVYCIATHGLFGGDALEELQDCDCIDTIVVTNSFPISPEKALQAKKLLILDLSHLLAEAIRRNHYGESISALFTHSYD